MLSLLEIDGRILPGKSGKNQSLRLCSPLLKIMVKIRPIMFKTRCKVM